MSFFRKKVTAATCSAVHMAWGPQNSLFQKQKNVCGRPFSHKQLLGSPTHIEMLLTLTDIGYEPILVLNTYWLFPIGCSLFPIGYSPWLGLTGKGTLWGGAGGWARTM